MTESEKLAKIWGRGREDGYSGRKRKTFKTPTYDASYQRGYEQGIRDKNWRPGGVSTLGYHPGGVPISRQCPEE